MREIRTIIKALAISVVMMDINVHVASRHTKKLSIASMGISSKKANKNFSSMQKKKVGNFKSKLNSKPNSVRKDFNQRRR